MVLHKHGDKLYDGLTATVREHLQRMAADVEAANDQEFLETLNRKWSDHKLSMIMIRDILMYMVRGRAHMRACARARVAWRTARTSRARRQRRARPRPRRTECAATAHALRGVPVARAQDRTFVAQHKKVPVYELGLSLFRDDVVRAPRIKERLLSQLLELVRKERDGEMINRRLVKMVVAMLVDLGKEVYSRDFERPFLDATAVFYQHESGETIAQNSASDYMKRAERRLAEEDERVQQYLDSSTEPKLREVAERELIARHMKALVDMERSGLVVMLDDDRRGDLSRTYALFKRVQTPTSGLHVIRDLLSTHVREQGKSIVDSVGDESAGEAQRDPISFVDDLLKLKDRYDRIVDDCFASDKLFHNTLNRAFESFLNLSSRSPEYLSLYVDNLLRRDMKGSSEDEVESTLDKIVMLFRYLQEKDVFEKYYKQHLAKRLLSGRVTSDDTERSMISKLKTECGFQFTSKIEGMFTDMRTSADTMAGFRAHLAEEAAAADGAADGGGGGSGRVGTVELSVQVLTTGYWPTQPPSNCIFPPEIQRCVDTFSRFYQSKHSGRTLKWHANMGNADLRATFGSRKHEVNVSTYQMCLLLLFNDRDTITYADLANATHIPTIELKRALQSLACAKFKLLTKVRSPARGAAAESVSSPAARSPRPPARRSPRPPARTPARPGRSRAGATSRTRTRSASTTSSPRSRSASRCARRCSRGRAARARAPPTKRAAAARAPAAAARAGRHRRGDEGDGRGEVGDAAQGGRGPQAAGGGRDRAHHEIAQGARAQPADHRGDAAAQGPLHARPEHDQEAHREPHRARVPRARQGGLAHVQVPRLAPSSPRRSCGRRTDSRGGCPMMPAVLRG